MSLGISGIGMPTATEQDTTTPSFLRHAAPAAPAPGTYPSTSSFHPTNMPQPPSSTAPTGKHADPFILGQTHLAQVDSNYVDSMSDFEALSKRFQELKKKS